jgi:hypothetical protein
VAPPREEANENADGADDNAPDETPGQGADAAPSAPGNSDERANEDESADDEDREDGEERPDQAAQGTERSDNANSVGPSDELPEQAPGHVSEIHDTIGAFLDGSIDDLGDALSDLLGDDGENEDDDGDDEDSEDENDDE